MKTLLDCFNGVGLMDGTARYGVLEARLAVCAGASRKMTELFGKLLQKMLWPVPPKKADEMILPYLTTGDENLERAAIKALREQSASVIMLARSLREAERGSKKADEASALAQEWEGILAALEDEGEEESR